MIRWVHLGAIILISGCDREVLWIMGLLGRVAKEQCRQYATWKHYIYCPDDYMRQYSESILPACIVPHYVSYCHFIVHCCISGDNTVRLN